MVKIDIRLKEQEILILQSLVGKELVAIRRDSFNYINSSSQVVQIEAENGLFYLYSFTEPLDYFGTKEDVAVWTIETERYQVVDRKVFIETPIKEKIKSVSVIQENQRLFKNGDQTYDVWLTRGLVFDFGNRQLSFEKAIWFSEDIYIHKGYDLSRKFSSVDAFVNNDWDEGVTAECEREIITLEEKS